MRKKLAILISIVSILSGFSFLGLMATPAPVSAAAGVCFGGGFSKETMRVVDCKNLADFVQTLYGHGIQDDHCYIQEAMGVRELGSTQDLPAGDPLDGWECSVLAGATQQTESKPSKCYMLDAPTIAPYDSLSYKPEQITTTECSPDKAAIIKASDASFTTFQNGACYIFTKGTDYRRPACATLETFNQVSKEVQQRENEKTNAANASKSSEALKNETRKKVQDCTGESCITDNPLVVIVKAVVNFVSVLVAVIVVIMIIIGGIQYSSAGGSPQKTAEAKNRITNAILAFVMYIFLFAFLQWLIPGGVLK